MAEIKPVQHPQPLPHVEQVRRDHKQSGQDQSRRDEREECDEQPPSQQIDEYA